MCKVAKIFSKVLTYSAYSGTIRKSQVEPRILFEIIVCAYQATESRKKSTVQQGRIAALVKAYLNEIWSYITNAERPTVDNPIIRCPIGYNICKFIFTITPFGYNMNMDIIRGVIAMNKISKFIRKSRKAAGLTQEEFAARSGLGLRFVRELEQGKTTVRMDKVNEALAMFGMEAVPGRKDAD